MLSPSFFNERVAVIIQRFFDRDLSDLYSRQRWVLPPCHRKNRATWDNGHFHVHIESYQIDTRINALCYEMRIPGYSAPNVISEDHQFGIELPVEYPNHLDQIRITNKTPLWHMRIHTKQTGLPPCLAIKGDIDRVLFHLIFFVLLRPDVVLPVGSDSGLNSEMTTWYRQQGPHQVYERLWGQWARQQAPLPHPSEKQMVTVIRRP